MDEMTILGITLVAVAIPGMLIGLALLLGNGRRRSSPPTPSAPARCWGWRWWPPTRCCWRPAPCCFSQDPEQAMAEKKAYPLRISVDVLEALQRWADDELRSANAQIEYVLRDALRKSGRLKAADDDGADAAS